MVLDDDVFRLQIDHILHRRRGNNNNSSTIDTLTIDDATNRTEQQWMCHSMHCMNIDI